MNIEFSAQIAVVAGGTGGLGKAVSLAFLGEGAKTVVTYRKEEEFRALKEVAGPNISLLEGHCVDVTDETATAEFIRRVMAGYGKLDALVNAVGGYTGGIKVWDLSSLAFDRMLALNLRSGFILSRAAVPAMLRAGRGSIVNVAAKAAFDHGAGAGAYAASKAAAVGLMEALAADCKGTGVRVNSVLRASSIQPQIVRLCRKPTSQPGRSLKTLRKLSFSSAARVPRRFTVLRFLSMEIADLTTVERRGVCELRFERA